MEPLQKIAKILADNGEKELAAEIADVSLTLKQLKSKQAASIKNRKFGLFPSGDMFKGGLTSPIFVGTLPELNNYAIKQGWKWKRNQSLFGGYWVDPKSDEPLESYEIDIV